MKTFLPMMNRPLHILCNLALLAVFLLHKNSFVFLDERRCAPASPLIIPNGHFESMNNTAKKTMDSMIVVKAGCAFKAFKGENKTGQSHLAEGPVVLLEGFPFSIKSFECHCPKLLKIDCIPEEKFIPVHSDFLARFDHFSKIILQFKT